MKDKYKQMYMEFAVSAAKTSEAERLKVGCVIVTSSGMVASGLNGTPEGWYTNICEDLVRLEDDDMVFNEFIEGVPYKLVTKPEVRHVERAALDKMLAEGVSSKDAIVFITHSPCEPCALALIGAKVKEVYYKDLYRCDNGIKLLEKANIKVEQLDYEI